MPTVECYVFQSDFEAAKRIGRKMLPERPEYLDPQDVIAKAIDIGMAELRKVWNDAEDQANLYANAMVKRDKLSAGREDGDRTTDGVPLNSGE